MLTHKEFHERARELAAGKYFSTTVEASEPTPGSLVLEYKLYVSGHGWHEGRTAELAIESFTNTPPPTSPELVAALNSTPPEASAPAGEPEQDVAF